VRIYDCKAEDGCGEVVRFKTRMGRGGVVEDVLYENIEADGLRLVFNFNMDAFSTTWLPEEFRTPVPADKGTPVFRNIRVRNLKATHCESAGRLIGLTTSPLCDLTLENVNIEAKSGFTSATPAGLRFENVKLNGVPVSAPRDTVVGQIRSRVAEIPMSCEFSARRALQLLTLAAFVLTAGAARAQRQMEKLSRGVVAVRASSTQVYVGWRLLGTDPDSIGFNLYRSTAGGAG